jgi:hypothetical protein
MFNEEIIIIQCYDSRMIFEQVRPILECLCQILSFYGFSTITCKDFHLAELDRNEAVRMTSSWVHRSYVIELAMFRLNVSGD